MIRNTYIQLFEYMCYGTSDPSPPHRISFRVSLFNLVLFTPYVMPCLLVVAYDFFYMPSREVAYIDGAVF